MRFRNRSDAGRQLARLVQARALERPVVLGMARGGVPVAAEVARTLGAPLDVLVVRKLGYPRQPELALGAIGEGGVRVLNADLVDQLGVPEAVLEEVSSQQGAELRRRLEAYRAGLPPVDLTGRNVVVVDDGLATGATARAAVAVARQRGAATVVLAVPVAPPAGVRALMAETDDIVCVEVSERFFGIGQWYDDFHQVADDEVRRLLAASRRDDERTEAASNVSVTVPVQGVMLPGELVIPARPRGLVVFAHGSGSSRLSPRNQAVASTLHQSRLATFLFDLLTEAEAANRSKVFDIGLLGLRLSAATEWVRRRPLLSGLPVGLFGASTGAAAALVAAARTGSGVAAVVSRGGRPDLAPPEDLASVEAPVLLIVGSADTAVLEWNRQVLELLPRGSLEIVGGASHLFEEPGALERVADLAADFFSAHFAASPSADEPSQ